MAGCIGLIILAIVIAFISPILSFFLGYVSGQIIEWVIGGQVMDGMNLLFNTTRFTPNMLPMICGALAVIGSFFKSSNIKTKD